MSESKLYRTRLPIYFSVRACGLIEETPLQDNAISQSEHFILYSIPRRMRGAIYILLILENTAQFQTLVR